MKKLPLVLLTAVGLMAFAAPAFATEERITRRVNEVFARLDTDHDGRISRAEADRGERLAKHFDQIDADRNGFVSRAELTVAFERAAARR